MSAITIVLFIYFARAQQKAPRTIILLMCMSSMVLIPFFRYVIKSILYKIKVFQKKIAIIGSGKTGRLVKENLGRVWYLGYDIIGFIKHKKDQVMNKDLIIGDIKNLVSVISKYHLSSIIIIEEGLNKDDINSIISQCESSLSEIKIVPDALSIKTQSIHPEYVNELLLLNLSNNLAIPANRLFKFLFDYIFIPVYILITILIKLDSDGPIFFIEKRIGSNGKLFNFFKFRTMYIDGDKRLANFLKKNKQAQKEWKTFKKLKGFDPRITRIGKFLRKYSLDELPQFINVLKGDMSVIGPRPYLIRNKAQIGKYFSIIFKVKPGLTGLWQIRGRSDLSFNERLKLDEFYVRNWSFFLDFMILAKTIKVVLTGEGAY